MPAGFEDFYNVLDDFFSGGTDFRRSLARDTFKVDIEEMPNEFRIHAELPGVKKEEIGLELNEGRLTISVKKEENAEEEKKNYIHRERRSNSMVRGIHLGDVRAEGIKASLENGILTVTVEKEQKTNKAVSIEIN
jgi:HSP20 family protein